MGNQPFAIVCQGVHYDNSAIMTFLSSCLTILTERGVLTPAISDEFAQELRIVNLELADAGQEALLDRLLTSRSRFLELMHCRFGVESFTSNLFRYTAKGILEDLAKDLSELGLELVSRSELHLNRRFLVRKLGEPESQQIYAAILLDLGQAMDETATTIADILREIGQFHAHMLSDGSKVDMSIDAQIAQALGFKNVRRCYTYRGSDHDILSRLSASLQRFVDVLFSVTESVKAYYPSHHDTVVMRCDLLTAQLHRFGVLHKSHLSGRNAQQGELRRRVIIDTLADIKEQVRLLGSGFVQSFSDAIDVKEQPPHYGFESLAVKRRALYSLIATGVDADRARTSCERLGEYCQKNSTELNGILPGEFTKIDSNLPDSFADIFSQGSKEEENETKSEVLKLSTSLKVRFSEQLGKALSLILVLLAFANCGVKTQPQFSEPLCTSPSHEGPEKVCKNSAG